MAVGILLITIGLWLVLRLFKGGLAGQLTRTAGLG